MLRVSLKSEWGSNPDGYLLPLVTLGKLLHLHKTQAPDEVEEKDGSQNTIERDVGDEETGVVADGPGQVLWRETQLDVGVSCPPGHVVPTAGVYTASPAHC